MKVFLLISVVFFCSVAAFTTDGVVFCYWGTWANSRPSLGRYGVSDLPRDLCTHIVYSFIGLESDGSLTYPAEETLGGKSNSIEEFMSLKEENSNLTLLVAIGGWTEGSADFSIVSNNDTLRANFVDNLVSYIGEEGFDGLDLDWEYPGQRENSSETDKEAFIWLLRDLKTAFEPRGWLLTAAVGVTQYHIETSYDVPSMAELLDYINLMAYDLNGSWNPVTGVNAPLYPQLTDDSSELNVDAVVNTWISSGANPSKLVLGLAAYGRTFNLESLVDVGIGAAADGPGEAGLYTSEAGFMSYYEICLHQAQNVWNVNEVSGNYVYGNSGYLWVGYDNQNTIYAKGEYAKRNGLAGIMYWAVDLDDFAGYCGSSYPLIRAGIEGYNNSAYRGTASVLLLISVMAVLLK